MPWFFALVDARPGQEESVEKALASEARIAGATRCKEVSYDFLVKFEAVAFDTVDDFLQTHVRTIPGVVGVEIVQDFDDYGAAVREARDRLA